MPPAATEGTPLYTEMVRQNLARHLAALRRQASGEPTHLAYLDQLLANPADIDTPIGPDSVGPAAYALGEDVRWISQIGRTGFTTTYPHAYETYRYNHEARNRAACPAGAA